MKVTNYIPHIPTDREKYIAEFDVENVGTEHGALTFRRFRVIQGKNGPFISWPSYPISSEDGQSKKYVPFFDFGFEAKKKIDAELQAQINMLTAVDDSF